ncbi:MAG: F0F1 ATP synthase subunit epsilon [Bacteroidia bacterium]|nr:F0F1 ATP synthase subunit epsilon [Bacteroidia bacterium]MCX7651248.1 F0F1 ATP synthase subunit epsilon [Bacteroidia bacterium]MDW8416196.1 F0F1 ATP synthase subunit epsilon [Bacteroidia bacterium]
MRVAVYSPGGPLFEGDARSVAATSPEGAFEVLQGHAPMIAQLVSGPLKIATSEGEKTFLLQDGYLIVSPQGEVRVLLRQSGAENFPA